MHKKIGSRKTKITSLTSKTDETLAKSVHFAPGRQVIFTKNRTRMAQKVRAWLSYHAV
jgi:hypothetical protein